MQEFEKYSSSTLQFLLLYDYSAVQNKKSVSVDQPSLNIGRWTMTPPTVIHTLTRVTPAIHVVVGWDND